MIALYVRVSTQEQKLHGLSLGDQRQALISWAGERPYRVYEDAGVSGRAPISKRPAMLRMLQDVEAGEIEHVAFIRLDRFFRSVQEYYKANEVLEKAGVPWTAILEDYETATSAGRFKVNIMLSVAQAEAERTSERIRSTYQAKRERGETTTNRPPIGLAKKDKKLVVSEDAPIVQEVFQEYLATGSTCAALRKLNELTGRVWCLRSIHGILGNRAYLEHGVIDRDTFTRAAELRKERSSTANKGRVFLFSSLIYYGDTRLSANYHNGTPCYRVRGLPGISEAKVEKFLLDTILKDLENETVRLKQAKKKKPVDKAALRRKADKLTDLYLSDLISREKYEVEYRAVHEILDAPEPEETHLDMEMIRTALEMYQALSREKKRAFWLKIIRRIDLHPDRTLSVECVVRGAHHLMKLAQYTH